MDTLRLSNKPLELGSHQELKSQGFRLFISEFLGTFLLVHLSQSGLTSFELLGTQNDTINRQAGVLLIYGLAYMLAILLTLNLSGAHLNPAYTMACALYGQLKWSHALNYLAAQYSSSFVAAIFLHATYSDKLNQRHSEGLLTGMNSTFKAHGNILSTGKFFSSYPPTEVSLTQLSISYILASAHLMLMLQAVQDSRLIKVPRSMRPVYMASALVLIHAAFAANGGPVLNPAQDFSPRLYIALFGWGSAAFNLYHYAYWWICGLIAPHVGALIGFALYRALIRLHDSNSGSRNETTHHYVLPKDVNFRETN